MQKVIFNVYSPDRTKFVSFNTKRKAVNFAKEKSPITEWDGHSNTWRVKAELIDT